jgi:hypothetical protein
MKYIKLFEGLFNRKQSAKFFSELDIKRECSLISEEISDSLYDIFDKYDISYFDHSEKKRAPDRKFMYWCYALNGEGIYLKYTMSKDDDIDISNFNAIMKDLMILKPSIENRIEIKISFEKHNNNWILVKFNKKYGEERLTNKSKNNEGILDWWKDRTLKYKESSKKSTEKFEHITKEISEEISDSLLDLFDEYDISFSPNIQNNHIEGGSITKSEGDSDWYYYKGRWDAGLVIDINKMATNKITKVEKELKNIIPVIKNRTDVKLKIGVSDPNKDSYKMRYKIYITFDIYDEVSKRITKNKN